jgi:hypothetical protein
LPRAFNGNSFQLSQCVATVCELLFGAVERAMEAGIVEGFQEIVEGSCFEGAQGILIVGGNENDGWRKIAAEEFEKVEAVALGHLDVEENQVRLGFADLRQGLGSRATLACDFDFRIEPQKYPEVAAGQRFIVDDDRTNLHGAKARRANLVAGFIGVVIYGLDSGGMNGRESDTSTPPS